MKKRFQITYGCVKPNTCGFSQTLTRDDQPRRRAGKFAGTASQDARRSKQKTYPEEWNAPIWFASLDLTKAFDRIEYSPLFDALLQQGVPRCYCTLLWKLYKGQTGSVHGTERFTIERGVKQGDVISPILFNAG